MGYFGSAEEVYEYLGGVFRELVEDPEVGPKLNATGLSVTLSYTDPDATIFVDFGQGVVLTGADIPDDARPSVQFWMSTDVAHRFWLGRLNPTVALTKGEMKAKGPVSKILKLLPLLKQVFPKYRDLLERAGRTDLASVGQ